MDKDIFKDGTDYWMVARNIKNLYLSDGSVSTLLDFERVLDSVDLYAFKNWILGELVAGPEISRYHVTCTFMWPANLMPDPRGGSRLLPFDCEVKFLKKRIQIPVKIKDPSDYRPGTHKAKMIEEPIWLVEIRMPRSLMEEIRTGSVEVEGEEIDLSEIDDAYTKGLDQEGLTQQAQQSTQPTNEIPAAPAPNIGTLNAPQAPAPLPT